MDIKLYILAGGPIVLLLLVLFVIVLIIIIERYTFFKNYEIFLKQNHQRLLEKNLTFENLKEFSHSIALEINFSSNWILFLNKIGEISKTNKDKFFLYLEEYFQYLINQELPKMEKYLVFLATLGNLSPFIGLLGTVFGIIRSFMHLGETNLIEVNKGIAEALIATAFGLIVAIPSSFSYNYFRKKIDKSLLLYEDWFRNLKLKLMQSE